MKRESLRDVIAGEQNGFKLRIGYFAELEHGLMGSFPALFKDPQSIVITVDAKLIREVVKTLAPRRMNFRNVLCLVHESTGVGYVIPQNVKGISESGPITFLTRAEFEGLIAEDPHPFEWAPGLVGAGMDTDQYDRLIDDEAKKIV